MYVCTFHIFLVRVFPRTRPGFVLLYFLLNKTHSEYLHKNPWRRKCVRRVIFRKGEVGIRPPPVQPLPGLQHGCWVAVRPARAHLTLKMNITFFIRNLMLNIFLFHNFFEKKTSIFRENHEKLFWGTFDHFLGKGGVLSQKLRKTALIELETYKHQLVNYKAFTLGICSHFFLSRW